MNSHALYSHSRPPLLLASLITYGLVATSGQAEASFIHGETLDTVANVIAWFALILAPIVLITVFLMIHILPEKIAHKRGHPQTGAIQCLCLLSLVFGGLLWPIAWLWAYTKPVLHKMAYGTDKAEDHGADAPDDSAAEIERLRARLNELEARNQNQGGKI
jgi:CBS domain containing-hemolysin-like protein